MSLVAADNWWALIEVPLVPKSRHVSYVAEIIAWAEHPAASRLNAWLLVEGRPKLASDLEAELDVQFTYFRQDSDPIADNPPPRTLVRIDRYLQARRRMTLDFQAEAERVLRQIDNPQ